MIITTTHTIEGKTIVQYHGIVCGEAILGTNIFRDFFASIRDIGCISVLQKYSKNDKSKITLLRKVR